DRQLSFKGSQGQDRGGSCPLMLLAELAHEAAKQRGGSGVSTHPDLMIELSPIPAPRLPTVENVGFVRIKDTATIRRSAALRKGCCDQKPTHCPAGHLEAASNLSLRERLLVERAHGFIACRAISATDLRGS